MVLGYRRSFTMRKFAFAAVCTLFMVGFAFAEEFTLQISKISDDGTSVTGTKAAGGKGGKGGKGGGFGKGEEVTVKVASSVKVFKGKFDTDSKSWAAEGDDLKLTGLKAAFTKAQNGNVTVDGKSLADSDTLTLTIKDGKPAAKLNGKDVDFTTVRVTGKTNLGARVTTSDDGTVTQVLLTPAGGFGGFGGGKKGGN
jgi:hypothetical protein